MDRPNLFSLLFQNEYKQTLILIEKAYLCILTIENVIMEIYFILTAFCILISLISLVIWQEIKYRKVNRRLKEIEKIWEEFSKRK